MGSFSLFCFFLSVFFWIEMSVFVSNFNLCVSCSCGLSWDANIHYEPCADPCWEECAGKPPLDGYCLQSWCVLKLSVWHTRTCTHKLCTYNVFMAILILYEVWWADKGSLMFLPSMSCCWGFLLAVYTLVHVFDSSDWLHLVVLNGFF